jgi:Uma2 family endonuclease
MTALLDRPKVRKSNQHLLQNDGTFPKRYEVIEGKVVELEYLSAYAAVVANRLHTKLVLFTNDTHCGRSRMGMLYAMPIPVDPSRCRHPDIAFTSYSHWPLNQPISLTAETVDSVPELAVEVACPNRKWDLVIEKAYEYLSAGVRLVWLISPKHKQVYIYHSQDAVRIVGESELLDGGDVLPEFTVLVGSLFPPIAVETPR